jgi:hypothetical protein
LKGDIILEIVKGTVLNLLAKGLNDNKKHILDTFKKELIMKRIKTEKN